MAIFAILKKRHMFNLKNACILLLTCILAGTSVAQTTTNQDERADEIQLNTITTAVPFLMIGPDARGGGMAEVGAATTPDGNSIHWNPSKLAFIDKDFGVHLSYTPWLRALVPDINLAYLSGYGQIGKKKDQTISGSLRFFSLGNIQFTDQNGNAIRDFNPNEFALDVAYARKLSKEFSGGIALRYIYSNLTGGINVGGADTKPGQAFAADLSFYYNTKKVEIKNMKTEITAGINFSNIGSKMTYTETNEQDFIPTNMRLGVGFKLHVDDHNSLAVYADASKLLVPTPPIYMTNAAGTGDSLDINTGERIIQAGKDPNVNVPVGIFQSFGDAPGGTAEEFREVNWSSGLEYFYNNQFGVRAGYFHEHATKGDRQFFTIGATIRYNVFGLDFAYLIPMRQQHPLANTLRFTLTFDFDSSKKKKEESTTE
jgi:hypothetical protein